MAAVYNNISDSYGEEMDDHGRKNSQKQLSKANGASKIDRAAFEIKYGPEYDGISSYLNKESKKHTAYRIPTFEECLKECFGMFKVYDARTNMLVSPGSGVFEEYLESVKELQKELIKTESPGDLRKAFNGEQQRTEDVLTIGKHVAMKTMAEVEQMDEEDMDVAIAVFEGTVESAGGAFKRKQTLRRAGKGIRNLARAYNS